MNDTYNLLRSIVGEHDVSPATGEFQRAPLNSREYAAAYLLPSTSSSAVSDDLTQAYNRPETVQLRKKIIQGSIDWLQEQFLKHVEATLLKNPTLANLGGIPSISNKIRAYVTVMHKQNGNWAAGLEVRSFGRFIFVLAS